MRIRRLAGAAATAAVLTPLLMLTAGAQANAATQSAYGPPLPPPVPSEVSPIRYEQCRTMWNANYWSGGAAFATGQWYACINAPTLVRDEEPVLVPDEGGPLVFGG
ncbi:hypothetical protein [Kitasatospora sp. NPDC008115]|uniref:hypothetical protein n=1 Tax=Kitasatospora sp. NPDC008115 TaxID=3364022 RepID=UPI0036EF4F7C